MTTINLDDINPDLIFLVIEEKTSVFYTKQCAGIGCSHPMIEGYMIPIMMDEEWEEFGYKTCEYGCQYNLSKFINIELPVKEINKINIFIDKERLQEGTEAFVPIVYGDKKGWIFTNNCD